ncbi:hypothetical protein PFISCL1PPCAC_28789 [Pristionchus fissidentatus]|uniref:Fibrinogen C-terminal domain-containing protein n=1 Tax=Pristionchus fissidentatus TaxID=1538716 RepID=A0AAV5WZ39_9BILA|nr:hypothetical protein PFISCL1PPCAC_22732 [Pristionchus fissidentatus]GMT37492.1 hypothetical protein PFISCL1PPCAC_28789 [Pristionchus fissidentatus]
MRAAYHSEYRPGALDTSELDPCIAAETRLKKSSFSTSKKRTLCLLAALALVFLIFLVILFVVISESKPASVTHTVGDMDYEMMEGSSLVRKPPPPPPPPPATTTRSTVFTTTEHRSTTVRPTIRTIEKVTKKDEEPVQIQRVQAIFVPIVGRSYDAINTAFLQYQLPVEQPITTKTTAATAATTATTAAAPTTTTARAAMRTRPTSVFPTASLHDELPYARKSETIRESCVDHATASLGSGVYRISPNGVDPPFDVYCRMDEDDVVGTKEGVPREGGAWTYVQSLSEEAFFYNRTFAEYSAGFGRVDGSHWLGLAYMNRLAAGGANDTPATLRIELYGDYCLADKQCSGRPEGFWWGEWDFGLGSSSDFFPLHISFARHGNLTVQNKEDVFYSMNNGRQFTTADADHDADSLVNCGQTRNFGGWWHHDCTYVALNGLYGDFRSKLRYQVWYRAAMAGDHKFSYHIHPKRSIMMVRPRA